MVAGPVGSQASFFDADEIRDTRRCTLMFRAVSDVLGQLDRWAHFWASSVGLGTEHLCVLLLIPFLFALGNSEIVRMRTVVIGLRFVQAFGPGGVGRGAFAMGYDDHPKQELGCGRIVGGRSSRAHPSRNACRGGSLVATGRDGQECGLYI